MSYCFGIDVGGTSVKMGLFSYDGELREKWEIKTRTENRGVNILPDIYVAIQNKMSEKNIGKEDILGIGIGIPAPVGEDGIVTKTANLGWGYKEVQRELEEMSGVKVKVGNDANIAALGEMWKGGGLGHRNLIMVTLGTGVGGGIIINGRIVGGAHGSAGEIGHITVDYEEEKTCGCGRTGCLEQYASATGIARLAREKLGRETRKTCLQRDTVTAKSVFDGVKEGDVVSIEIAEMFGNYLGHALSNLAIAVDPDVIVIGGGVSKAGEILLDFVKKPFQEQALFTNQKTRFVLAKLGNDAGIYGAAKLILN